MTARLILSTATPGTRDGLAHAAAVCVAAARGGERPALLVSLEREPRRRPATLLASPRARALEAALREAGVSSAVARGHLCLLALPAEPESLEIGLGEAMPDAGVAVVHTPARLWQAAVEPGRAAAGLLRAELPGDRALAALVVGDLRDRGLRARVATRPLGRVAARRALAGVDPGGVASNRAQRLVRGLLGDQSGQSLPAMLGALAVLIVCTLALVAIGGAVTGKGRAQRAADLAAVSAARSMRDDAGRLSAPARFADGTVNPRHLSKGAFLARARGAARQAASANGVAASRVEVAFPDARETIPIRARVRINGELEPDPDGGPAPPIRVAASATAEASPPAGSWTGMPAEASGGGYSGPLAYRQGKGMRPDVAAAFDRMAAAAGKAGIALTITSAFRSDAEQAELFAAHPDPTWVAPPGHSLHRCATELDLGPPSAYGWLYAHSRSFGFLKRYSWEPWHFGYTAGPPPCSEQGNAIAPGGGPGNDGRGGGAGVPEFVPVRYRAAIVRSAGRRGVSAGLLAAQIMAESGFNPNAVSPAGAQGIAQFMPGTAASYGLRDPFDPEAAIDAQAHLMADLLRQFRSVPLALAAYNAGPGAVAGCHCIPYAETRAYVTRILVLLNGSGALLTPPLEVRLVS